MDQVVAEITARGLKRGPAVGPLLRHRVRRGDGQELQDRGVEVQRVFLAAQLLGDAADRRASIAELTRRSNADIVTDLSRGRRLHRARRVGCTTR